MSVWSEVYGTIKTAKGFSLKKYTKDLLSLEYSLTITPKQFYDEFQLSVCLDGKCAIDTLSAWCEGVQGTLDAEIKVRILK